MIGAISKGYAVHAIIKSTTMMVRSLGMEGAKKVFSWGE